MFLVECSSLDIILRTCSLCAGPCTVVFPCDSGKNKNDTAIKVMQLCTVCHFDRTWASQPKLGRLYVGNVATSAALLFSGNLFAKVARLFNLMHVPFNHQQDNFSNISK